MVLIHAHSVGPVCPRWHYSRGAHDECLQITDLLFLIPLIAFVLVARWALSGGGTKGVASNFAAQPTYSTGMGGKVWNYETMGTTTQRRGGAGGGLLG